MKFLTLSEQDIRSAKYTQIRDNHIVISISGSEDKETIIPNNPNRMGKIHLKFDDVEDIVEDYTYFDRGCAREILEFVDKYCTSVPLIVVQCKAGLSRSVGVASALAKIINGRDDDVFTKGIPNMFVYTTILDQFFGNPDWSSTYPKISTIRNRQLAQFLTPAMIRLYSAKNRKRV